MGGIISADDPAMLRALSAGCHAKWKPGWICLHVLRAHLRLQCGHMEMGGGCSVMPERARRN